MTGRRKTVRITGFDGKDVLFETDLAGVVQVSDDQGELSAMLVRIRPGIWGFSMRGDSDWNEMVSLYGGEGKAGR